MNGSLSWSQIILLILLLSISFRGRRINRVKQVFIEIKNRIFEGSFLEVRWSILAAGMAVLRIKKVRPAPFYTPLGERRRGNTNFSLEKILT
jgi:hypothetical protein